MDYDAITTNGSARARLALLEGHSAPRRDVSADIVVGKATKGLAGSTLIAAGASQAGAPTTGLATPPGATLCPASTYDAPVITKQSHHHVCSVRRLLLPQQQQPQQPQLLLLLAAASGQPRHKPHHARPRRRRGRHSQLSTALLLRARQLTAHRRGAGSGEVVLARGVGLDIPQHSPPC